MIKINKISKSYKGKTVLSDIDFSTEKGTCVALVGENGSGKTTLLRIMLDMIPPDSGNVAFDEISIAKSFPEHLKKQIGAYLNDDMLIEDLTGKEYLSFIAKFYQTDFEQKMNELLKIFQFEDVEKFEGEKIYNYSLGMKRKIGLISVLLHDPLYLILDEPFSSLDFKVVHALLDYLNNFKPSTHIIMTTHVLSYIDQIADKVILLKDGEIRFNGETSELELENVEKITTLLNTRVKSEE